MTVHLHVIPKPVSDLTCSAVADARLFNLIGDNSTSAVYQISSDAFNVSNDPHIWGPCNFTVTTASGTAYLDCSTAVNSTVALDRLATAPANFSVQTALNLTGKQGLVLLTLLHHGKTGS